MLKIFGRLRTGFLVAFFVLSATAFAYNALWAAPERRCLEGRNWWDWRTRTCGRVVYLPDITHKQVKGPRGTI